MIISNYNGSLPENTETDMTSIKSPVVNIRFFDPNIKAGNSLVIPYYVSDWDETEYRDEKLGPTFTTIFTLDEDTLPANQVTVWKQTTYAGEQVIDLGEFNDVGIHTLNVRTIQSNGVGSATKPLKFAVHPAGTMPMLDLNTLSGFTGEFTGYRRTNLAYEEPGGSNIVKCFEEEYNCSYSVAKTVETENGVSKVTDIQIVVTKPSGGDCITAYELDDYGERRIKNGDYKVLYNLNFNGEFHLATRCTINAGQANEEVVELKDYLGVPMADLPPEVMAAAAKNKVALTRLFEAARAWRFQQVYEGLLDGISSPTDQQKEQAAITASGLIKHEFTFKMPKMDIVCDYHYAYNRSHYYWNAEYDLAYLNGTPENGYADGWIRLEGVNKTTENGVEVYGESYLVSHGNAQAAFSMRIRDYYGRDDVMMLDDTTVDLNGSTLSMLQINNVLNGRLLHMLHNVNSHIINGKFIGHYKGVKYAHANDMESLHMIAIHSSQFCSVERLDVSWSVGYELHVGNHKVAIDGSSNKLLFNSHGLIGYDGSVILGNSANSLDWFFTDDAASDGLDDTSGQRYLKVLLYGGRCGREFRVIKGDEGSDPAFNKKILIHTATCRDMYYHFYDREKNFIKTVKSVQRWPVLIPYGAVYAKMSMYGTITRQEGDAYMDWLLNDLTIDGARRDRRFCLDYISLSWGSGVNNVTVHDTRTCTLDNGGVQTYTRNMRFWNVANARNNIFTHYAGDNTSYTKMLIDQEDDAYNLYNWSMENLHEIFGDTRAISASRGYDGHIKGCDNVHIGTGGAATDVLIENCSLSTTIGHSYRELGGGAHYIIRNCIVKNAEVEITSGPYENGNLAYLRGNTMLVDAGGNANFAVNDTIKL